ncbi:MAG: response regulator transcription factor [Planctomycetes bacterium]|nr:response regulator transcription factor [Planctomycetota bacterium]
MVIAVVSDLLFATRIAQAARHAGVPCAVAADLRALDEALAAPAPANSGPAEREAEPTDPPLLAVVDMNVQGVSPTDAIRAVKARQPEARVVAYFSHVQTAQAREARAAGADEVLPRSAFVERLASLFRADGGTPRPP